MGLRWKAKYHTRWERKHMRHRLMCRLFGHVSFSLPQFRVDLGIQDNVGTQHMDIICECRRCNREFRIGTITLNSVDNCIEELCKTMPVYRELIKRPLHHYRKVIAMTVVQEALRKIGAAKDHFVQRQTLLDELSKPDMRK